MRVYAKSIIFDDVQMMERLTQQINIFSENKRDFYHCFLYSRVC